MSAKAPALIRQAYNSVVTWDGRSLGKLPAQEDCSLGCSTKARFGRQAAWLGRFDARRTEDFQKDSDVGSNADS